MSPLNKLLMSIHDQNIKKEEQFKFKLTKTLNRVKTTPPKTDEYQDNAKTFRGQDQDYISSGSWLLKVIFLSWS